MSETDASGRLYSFSFLLLLTWISGLLAELSHAALILAVALHMTIAVGFAEELLGRGLLQNALGRRYMKVFSVGRLSIRSSTLLAALLFAFWHTEWLSFEPLTILGSLATSMTIVLVPSLLLCFVYEKTRSMLVVIALHDAIDGGKLLAWYAWSLIVPG